MNNVLQVSGSQESAQAHPVVWRVWEAQPEGLCGSLAMKRHTGFEEVMIDDLGLKEGAQAEVAFEATEGTRAGFEVGPFAFEPVVIGLFEEGTVDQVSVWADTEIAEGAAVAPEAVGKDIGVFQSWRGAEGHGEGVACGLGVAAGGEVVAQVDVIARDIGEPEPAFLSAPLELSFVGEETGLSAAFFGQHAQFCALIGEQEGGLVRPSGDGIVGEMDVEHVTQGCDDGGGGHGSKEREVKGKGDSGGAENHLVPVEHGLDLVLDEADLFGVGDEIEAAAARQGEVDLVGAAFWAFEAVTVASEAEGIGEAFEDAHVGAAFGTQELRVLFDARRAAGYELAPAAGILAAIALQARTGVFSEAKHVAATARTPHIVCAFCHRDLLSNRGVKKEKPMKITTLCPEGRSLVNNISFMR